METMADTKIGCWSGRFKGWIFTVVLTAATAACGGGSKVGESDGSVIGADGSIVTGGDAASCTTSESLGTFGVLKICSEIDAPTAAQRSTLQQGCQGTLSLPDAGVTADIMYADAPCTHTGALGGCRVTSGGVTETVWYYSEPGLTASTVQQLCAGTGTYVAP
jgi:hypothetical protein